VRLRCLIGWHQWRSIMHIYPPGLYAHEREAGWFEQRCRRCDAPWRPRREFPIEIREP
jgi:hypothetical protein